MLARRASGPRAAGEDGSGAGSFNVKFTGTDLCGNPSAAKFVKFTIEHAGSETAHPHSTRERDSCRDDLAAALAIRERDLGPKITNVIFRSLPSSAAAILLNFRGEATDYTATECYQGSLAVVALP